MIQAAEAKTLSLVRDGSVLFVTLDRPEKRNAINARMWTEIEETFDGIRGDSSVRAVVLRGAGGNFSAGGDISERSALSEGESPAESVAARNRRAGQIFMKIDRAPQAVIAVVEGYALGGGFGLACAADVTLAAQDAKFGLPEVTLGLAPAQIAPFLIRRIGVAQFRRLALTAARIAAAQAREIGIVHEVHADAAALQGALEKLLAAIDRAAPSAIAATKDLARRAVGLSEEQYLDESSQMLAELATGEDGREGAAAFKEKRKPRWQTGDGR